MTDWQKRLLIFLDTLPDDLDQADVCSWVNACYRVKRHKKHAARNCLTETTTIWNGTMEKEKLDG